MILDSMLTPDLNSTLSDFGQVTRMRCWRMMTSTGESTSEGNNEDNRGGDDDDVVCVIQPGDPPQFGYASSTYDVITWPLDLMGVGNLFLSPYFYPLCFIRLSRDVAIGLGISVRNLDL